MRVKIWNGMKTHSIYAEAVRALVIMALALAGTACSTYDPDFIIYPQGQRQGTDIERTASSGARNAFIIYSLGFNNLSGYLKEDINDIASGELPSHFKSDDLLLVFSHNTNGSYTVNTSPVLTRIYKDRQGDVVRDTVLVLPKGTLSASTATMNKVLTYIKEEYPAKHYGMLLSSHGTGWLPAGYANSPSSFESRSMAYRRSATMAPVPYQEKEQADGMPMVKSFGCQNVSSSSTYEMDINDMADAIPMKLDYMIFDACFMGGIEVAYEFRDVCDRMVFSQTEILADGMDYKTMTTYLLKEEPDLEGFCRNYFEHYNNLEGAYKSATISLVDCTALEPLAETCSTLFDELRGGITALQDNPSAVQRYYRSEYPNFRWFFDIESIISNAGADAFQTAGLREALDRCILYKAATENFMNSFAIRNHSGLSMYLPYTGREYLNSFYKELEWNKATGLVE